MASKGQPRKETFLCTYCDKSFSSRRALLVHQSSHKQRQTFSCPTCDKSFTQEHMFRRHMATHMKEQVFNYTCIICKAGFRNARQLERHHMANHAGEKPFVCDTCGMCFSWKDNLTKHERIHVDKPYACLICHKAFVDSDSLNAHSKAHKKELRLQNIASNGGEINPGDLEDEKEYICKICNQSFKYAFTLEVHSKGHKESDGPDFGQNFGVATHDPLKPYRCDICNEAFRWDFCLEAHKKIHDQKVQDGFVFYKGQKVPKPVFIGGKKDPSVVAMQMKQLSMKKNKNQFVKQMMMKIKPKIRKLGTQVITIERVNVNGNNTSSPEKVPGDKTSNILEILPASKEDKNDDTIPDKVKQSVPALQNKQHPLIAAKLSDASAPTDTATISISKSITGSSITSTPVVTTPLSVSTMTLPAPAVTISGTTMTLPLPAVSLPVASITLQNSISTVPIPAVPNVQIISSVSTASAMTLPQTILTNIQLQPQVQPAFQIPKPITSIVPYTILPLPAVPIATQVIAKPTSSLRSIAPAPVSSSQIIKPILLPSKVMQAISPGKTNAVAGRNQSKTDSEISNIEADNANSSAPVTIDLDYFTKELEGTISTKDFEEVSLDNGKDVSPSVSGSSADNKKEKAEPAVTDMDLLQSVLDDNASGDYATDDTQEMDPGVLNTPVHTKETPSSVCDPQDDISSCNTEALDSEMLKNNHKSTDKTREMVQSYIDSNFAFEEGSSIEEETTSKRDSHVKGANKIDQDNNSIATSEIKSEEFCDEPCSVSEVADNQSESAIERISIEVREDIEAQIKQEIKDTDLEQAPHSPTLASRLEELNLMLERNFSRKMLNADAQDDSLAKASQENQHSSSLTESEKENQEHTISDNKSIPDSLADNMSDVPDPCFDPSIDNELENQMPSVAQNTVYDDIDSVDSDMEAKLKKFGSRNYSRKPKQSSGNLDNDGGLFADLSPKSKKRSHKPKSKSGRKAKSSPRSKSLCHSQDTSPEKSDLVSTPKKSSLEKNKSPRAKSYLRDSLADYDSPKQKHADRLNDEIARWNNIIDSPLKKTAENSKSHSKGNLRNSKMNKDSDLLPPKSSRSKTKPKKNADKIQEVTKGNKKKRSETVSYCDSDSKNDCIPDQMREGSQPCHQVVTEKLNKKQRRSQSNSTVDALPSAEEVVGKRLKRNHSLQSPETVDETARKRQRRSPRGHENLKDDKISPSHQWSGVQTRRSWVSSNSSNTKASTENFFPALRLTMKLYRCDNCNKVYVKKMSFLAHVLFAHKKRRKRAMAHRRNVTRLAKRAFTKYSARWSVKRTFECTECHLTFEKQGHLTFHEERHDNIMRTYYCHLCDLTMLTWLTCIQHQMMHRSDPALLQDSEEAS